MTHTCNTCPLFQPDDNKPDQGICRLFPPIGRDWAEVIKDDWCYQHPSIQKER